MPVVFISHSNQDDEPTVYLVGFLRRAGFDVWVDFENIRGGADWLCEIQAGIERCDAVVTILSKASLKSVWVEREILYAFQLGKPVFTALVDDVRLPLHLINIQYCDCRERIAEGAADLADSLKIRLSYADSINYAKSDVSNKPIEANFFPYVEQLPHGDIAANVARDLFCWARSIADELAFSGKTHPACHARIALNGQLLTLFTIRAFPKTPSLQLPLGSFAGYPPYRSKRSRRALLKKLNQLLPKRARLATSAADRRPTFPLEQLGKAEKLAAFKAIVIDICDNLRANA